MSRRELSGLIGNDFRPKTLVEEAFGFGRCLAPTIKLSKKERLRSGPEVFASCFNVFKTYLIYYVFKRYFPSYQYTNINECLISPIKYRLINIFNTYDQNQGNMRDFLLPLIGVQNVRKILYINECFLGKYNDNNTVKLRMLDEESKQNMFRTILRVGQDEPVSFAVTYYKNGHSEMDHWFIYHQKHIISGWGCEFNIKAAATEIDESELFDLLFVPPNMKRERYQNLLLRFFINPEKLNDKGTPNKNTREILRDIDNISSDPLRESTETFFIKGYTADETFFQTIKSSVEVLADLYDKTKNEPRIMPNPIDEESDADADGDSDSDSRDIDDIQYKVIDEEYNPAVIDRLNAIKRYAKRSGGRKSRRVTVTRRHKRHSSRRRHRRRKTHRR